jgi:hypothetical protein
MSSNPNPRYLDAHSIILNIIEIHIMYPNIINAVCKTLTELVEDDEIRDMMIQEGICEKILNVFRIYQNNSDIMSSCSYIIFNLTKNTIASEYIRNNLIDDEMEILSNLMDYFLGNEEQNQEQNQEQYDDIPALERIGDAADDAPSYDAPSYDAPSYNTPSNAAPSYNTPSYDAPSYNTPSNAAPSYPYEDEYLHINRDELIIVFD